MRMRGVSARTCESACGVCACVYVCEWEDFLHGMDPYLWGLAGRFWSPQVRIPDEKSGLGLSGRS